MKGGVAMFHVEHTGYLATTNPRARVRLSLAACTLADYNPSCHVE